MRTFRKSPRRNRQWPAAAGFLNMHIILTVVAVICVIGGFVGLFLGVIPSLILWAIAAFCILGAWRSRPARLKRREDRLADGSAMT